ncbi:MAG: SPFH domain-containing protein [Pseudomonadota bacterium]
MILATMFTVAVTLLLTPIILSVAFRFSPGLAVTAILECLGLTVLFATAYLSAYRKFFVIAESNEAVIRTGGLGPRATSEPDVATGKGLWCIPMIHKHTMLRFEQWVLTTTRRDKQALICQDCLLANVSITFKIAIPQTKEDVLRFLAAAGTRPLNDKITIDTLCGDTLETALRDAATSRPYQELFDGRDEVGKEIERSVSNDLPKMGLQLVSAKLTDVEPTALEFYDRNNPQHAVGLTKIVEITQDQNLKTKTKQLDTERLIRSQEVETQKQILTLNKTEAFASSEQEKDISIQRATNRRISEEAGIAKDEAIQKRQIEMQRTIALDNIAQQLATQEAEVLKTKAVTEAEIAKQKAVQVSQKNQEIELVKKEQEKQAVEKLKETELAEKEALKAAAEQKMNEAQTESERARQAVITVAAVEAANREKQKQIIQQEAESQRDLIKEQRQADARAYAIEKDAEARQKAAEADYLAKVKAAEAERESLEARAAGERAKSMVPVEVEQKKVQIEDQRVSVLQRELEAKSKHAAAGIEFELRKLEIEKNAQVRIETARAVAGLTSNVTAHIYGDQNTLASIAQGYARSFGIAAFLDGLDKEVPPRVKDLAVAGVGELGRVLTEVLKAVAGEDVDPAVIQEAVERALDEKL